MGFEHDVPIRSVESNSQGNLYSMNLQRHLTNFLLGQHLAWIRNASQSWVKPDPNPFELLG